MTESKRIGIQAIQSVLQKATQSNLSMFHNAGNISSNSILPRPSIRDILDMNTNASCSMICDINDQFISTHDISRSLVGLRFRDIILSFTSGPLIDENSPENIWYEYGIFVKPKLFMRIYTDPKQFLRLGYTLASIIDIIFPDRECCVSPDFMGIIDVEVSNQEEFHDVISCFDILLGGSKDIKDVRILNNELCTIGSSLVYVLRQKWEGVDFSSLKSNNIKDVETVFGIEAARNLIINLIDDSKYPDIVANFMTRTGTTRALKKDNLGLYNRGFVCDVSFERTRDSIVQNVLEGIEDPLDSIHSKIWAGSYIS
jgi:hypothetical protein